MFRITVVLSLLIFPSVATANGGGTIAYVRNGTEIRLIEADGSNDRRLWTHPDAKKELDIYDVEWRPDESSIAGEQRIFAFLALIFHHKTVTDGVSTLKR